MAHMPTAKVFVKGLVEKYDLSSEISDQLLSCSVGFLIGNEDLVKTSIAKLTENVQPHSEPLEELLVYFEQRLSLEISA